MPYMNGTNGTPQALRTVKLAINIQTRISASFFDLVVAADLHDS